MIQRRTKIKDHWLNKLERSHICCRTDILERRPSKDCQVKKEKVF